MRCRNRNKVQFVAVVAARSRHAGTPLGFDWGDVGLAMRRKRIQSEILVDGRVSHGLQRHGRGLQAIGMIQSDRLIVGRLSHRRGWRMRSRPDVLVDMQGRWLTRRSHRERGDGGAYKGQNGRGMEI